jgi:glycosyltransferase involved in cell wall biosynthesis
VPRRAELGVNFIGPVEFVNGLATSARGYAETLGETGVRLNVIPWRDGFERLERAAEFPFGSGALEPINIVHLNLDVIAERLHGNGPLPKFVSPCRYNIVVPYWELATVVPDHAAVFRAFDEVWCASSFMASAIAQATDRTVRVVRPMLVAPDAAPSGSAPVSLPPERFVFFYTADAGSILGRKNPRALLDAYLAEFSEEDGACCVIKIHYGSSAGDELKPFFEAAAARSDIIFIDRLLSEDELTSLFSRIDCYVSPHRTEGLGLTVIEAMRAGKPVIATNYGGVTDFVTERTAFPLAYRMVAVGDGNAPYPAAYEWAEPDQASLRQAMRTVMRERELAGRIAAEGRARVCELFSLESTARDADRELRRIWTTSAGRL